MEKLQFSAKYFRLHFSSFPQVKKWLHIIKNVTKAANAFIKVTLGIPPTSLPYFENKITFPIASNLFYLNVTYTILKAHLMIFITQ